MARNPERVRLRSELSRGFLIGRRSFVNAQATATSRENEKPLRENEIAKTGSQPPLTVYIDFCAVGFASKRPGRRETVV